MPRSSLLPLRAAALLLLAVLATAAPTSSASAQFAGVPRPPRARPTRAEVTGPTRDTTYRDTLPPTRLPDMKAWVDSATISLAGASSSGGQVTRPDSAAPAPGRAGTTPMPSPSRTPAAPDSMRNGARAPDTATPLPTVAVVGLVMLAAGLLLRRRAARGRA